MQDLPSAPDILDAVTDFLKAEVLPALSGRLAFDLRVSINALELVGRELRLGPASAAAETARLSALLGREGTLAELNAALAEQIADGSLDQSSPGLVSHLLATTAEKLAVDQPKYARFRRLTEEGL